MTESKVFLLLFTSVIVCSEQSIFSTIIRNNLNRYLKNPLFTKSFVRTSIWPGEQDDQGSSMGLIAPQSAQINEFIKSQNKFTNDHILEPYGNYNYDLMQLNNQLANLIAPSPSTAHGASPSIQSNKAIPKFSDIQSASENSFQPMHFNSTSISSKSDEKPNRSNSKSLVVSASNTNAYSDNKKLSSFNKNTNIYSLVNKTNSYIGDNIDNFLEPVETSTAAVNRYKTRNRNFENNLQNTNKYNQEKALNLKLEYGFRPLPQKSPLTPILTPKEMGKDFLSSNSIQSNSPVEFKSDEDNGGDSSKEFFDDENLYEELDDLASSDQSNNNNNNSNNMNRSMKSMAKPVESTVHNGNHLEDFSTDYKKYVSYPMETESSDIHKLAFTGVESFKPDHSFVDHSYNKNHKFVDTISNYPNIENFKTLGVECTHKDGYCEYDSSYPKDYVNSIITNCTSTIDNMYIEMPENLDDFKGYKSFIQVGQTNTRHYKNVSLCDSEQKYIRPSVIQDVKGYYYLILQSSYYFQQVPVEICSNSGSVCNVVGQCNSQVKCTQKYRTHMLISIDDTEDQNQRKHRGHQSTFKCPIMRMFRLPSSCVCELSGN